VIVTEATQGGWSAVAGLAPDDVIQAINGAAVNSASDFAAAMKAVFDKRPKLVQIFVKRGPVTHFIFIEPDWTHVTAAK